MSHLDELKRLESDLKNSEELRNKLDEACKRIQEAGEAGNDGEIMVAAARKLGYDISVAALEQEKAEAEQLDPAELEKVSGGDFIHNKDADGHDDWCWFKWHCLAALLHTNSASDYRVSCWSDYLCAMINKEPDNVPRIPDEDERNRLF